MLNMFHKLGPFSKSIIDLKLEFPNTEQNNMPHLHQQQVSTSPEGTQISCNCIDASAEKISSVMNKS